MLDQHNKTRKLETLEVQILPSGSSKNTLSRGVPNNIITRKCMEGLSKKQIKLIKFALNALAESENRKQDGYEHMLIEMHRIMYVIENQNKMDETEKPTLLN